MYKLTSCNNVFVYLLFLSTLMLVSCGKVPCLEDIYGTWEGELQGKELIFKFKNDKTCELKTKYKISESVEKVNGNFEMDFSKKPITLSIRNIPQLNHPLFTIIEFVNADSMRLANFAPSWRLRPIAFSNTSMNLKCIKKGM